MLCSLRGASHRLHNTSYILRTLKPALNISTDVKQNSFAAMCRSGPYEAEVVVL
jgi:hypothetical protein